MKKYLSLILALSVIFAFCPETLAQEPVFTGVEVNLFVEVPYGVPKAQSLVFELLDGDTGELLDSETCEIAGAAPLRLNFTVPEYRIGKKFVFALSQGEAELEYNRQTDKSFVIRPYSYPDEEGVWRLYCTEFGMILRPAWERRVNLKLSGKLRTDVPVYSDDDGALIPAWALESLGIESSFAADGGLMLTAGERSLLLYMGYLEAYANSGTIVLDMLPRYMDGQYYVPIRDVAKVFDCSIIYDDDGRTLNLSVGRSYYVQTPEERRINSSGVASDTSYLVWVSKSEYKVRVFLGSAGNWRLINSFDCAIGAPSSPTIEGTFKYYQRQERWYYDKYYCGPIMRFKGGYAIHSTLLRYNGTDYDGRVGMKISHGCVRVRPDDIEWLVYYVPLQTTIYVTA